LALDREDTLKKAEKLLRQGKLDGAIAEYVRVVEDQPRDWNTANTLGDLYVRAGQNDRAAAQYMRIADHFMREGFYPKAAALYKKILKITPDDERAQLQLAELSTKQGLLVDAKSYLNAVATRRRGRGDHAGASEIIVRLGSLDPSDIEARLAAARTVEEMGDTEGAAARYRELHATLLEKGKPADALEALRSAVRLNPQDMEGRAELAKAAVASGDWDGARAYLDRDTTGDDPALMAALAEIELRSGRLDEARDLLPELLARDRGMHDTVIELAWTLTEKDPDAGFVCIEAAVDASIRASEFGEAAAILQEFVTRVPAHITALLKLVEVCVDGGLEGAMYDAQAQLTDAYLATGQAAEARVIAEDLVAREPWERAHIERFRRSLVLLRISEPDTVIAERLSGQTPFTATDHFASLSETPTMLVPPAPAPHREAKEPPADATATQPRTVGQGLGAGSSEQSSAAGPATRAPDAKPAGSNPPGTTEIDLTSVLGDLHARPAVPAAPGAAPRPTRENLDQVFADFRKQADRQESGDQSAQHMTLARTYLEMDRADDAIASLTAAVRSPRHRFEAGALLGRLFKARGDAAHAIEWMERAAQAPPPSDDEGRALLYELGATLEDVGETARALAVFLELQADAGEYRDVSARVDRLARVQAGG
jgi:tetratricopeptide (TPR) repeat protein